MVVTVEIAKIPDNVVIEGSPDFVDRAQADLDLLAASPTGRQMLARMGEADGQELILRELTPEQMKRPIAGLHWREGDTSIAAIAPDVPSIEVLYHEMSHADASMHNARAPGMYLGGDVRNMPAELDADGDGFVSFEEIDTNDDGRIDEIDLDRNRDREVNRDDGWLPNTERQAEGDGVDPDQNPNTADVQASTIVDQPHAVTVKALRQEMGLPVPGEPTARIRAHWRREAAG